MTVCPHRLAGDLVVLEPLSLDHLDGLKAAVADGELWKLWYTSVPKPAEMRREIERRLALQEAGTMLPFTVIRRTGEDSGQIVGMTTFMNIAEANKVLEIGSTWYAASVQRTGLNAEAKLLLLRHAFEVLGFQRVELRTHSMNMQSRRAIERLGATLDGVLRRHTILPNGTTRDTAVYSILDYEWPSVAAGLRARLARD